MSVPRTVSRRAARLRPRPPRTFLLVDLDLDVQVDAGDDDIAEDIDGAHQVEDVGVVEGDLFGNLHHPEDDDEIHSVATRQTTGDFPTVERRRTFGG